MDVLPHPQLLEFLFAFKSKVSAVFKDILGIHEIHHLAVTRITKSNELIAFSSTPAMEYNLFSSPLWNHDKSYNPNWIGLETYAYWESLYNPRRYDELYFLKQIKHNFPLGLTLATQNNGDKLIYSVASHKSCSHTQELFASQLDDFYKIGHYCSNLFNPLFENCDQRST